MFSLSSPVGLRRFALSAIGLRQARKAVGDGQADSIWDGLSAGEQADLQARARALEADGVTMLVRGDPQWPVALEDIPTPPLYLFLRGNTSLLSSPLIGMCGSRKASERGLQAARVCGEAAAQHGMLVVSGYAAGVDTETHVAALKAGAGTVIVLPEGIANFRAKKAFRAAGMSERNTLVISQFPPTQRWTAGGAMTRNAIICTLGRALVVIEAGEKGGTLNAGRQALKVSRPVLALEFGEDGGRPAETPPGNKLLFDEGARRVGTVGQLREALAEMVDVGSRMTVSVGEVDAGLRGGS